MPKHTLSIGSTDVETGTSSANRLAHRRQRKIPKQTWSVATSIATDRTLTTRTPLNPLLAASGRIRPRNRQVLHHSVPPVGRRTSQTARSSIRDGRTTPVFPPVQGSVDSPSPSPTYSCERSSLTANQRELTWLGGYGSAGIWAKPHAPHRGSHVSGWRGSLGGPGSRRNRVQRPPGIHSQPEDVARSESVPGER